MTYEQMEKSVYNFLFKKQQLDEEISLESYSDFEHVYKNSYFEFESEFNKDL